LDNQEKRKESAVRNDPYGETDERKERGSNKKGTDFVKAALIIIVSVLLGVLTGKACRGM
jgi:hypothetical protein